MKKIIILVAVATIAGCSSAPPTIQQGPNAEVSFDGLHSIDNSVFQNAWADPDIDFSRYNKILPGNAIFEYRAVKKTSATSLNTGSSNSEFWIDDDARARLEAETSTIFNEEMGNSTRFEMTDAAGDDVLIIRGGLNDIMSRVPPQQIGRNDIFLRSVGEATLILEVVDSMSGEVIFRAVERRSAGSSTGGIKANRVTTMAEVRRMLRRWATTLREGLDSIPAQ